MKKGLLALLGLYALAAAGLYASASTKAFEYPERYPSGYPTTSEVGRAGPSSLIGEKGSSRRFTQPNPGGGYYENPTQ